MVRSVSPRVSLRSLAVSKRGVLWLALALTAVVLALFVAREARADGRFRAAPIEPPQAQPAVFSPIAGDAAIVIGCLSNTDCPGNGLCVKDPEAAADQPGDCVASFEEPALADPGAGEDADEEDAAAQAGCDVSSSGRASAGVMACLSALAAVAFLRKVRRVR